MTIPNPGDKVRPYDVHRAFSPGLPGQVATYKDYRPDYQTHKHLVTDSDGVDRYYDRVEIDVMSTSTEPKVGDKVKVYGYYSQDIVPDGTVGTFQGKKSPDEMDNTLWADVPFNGQEDFIVSRAFPRVELVKTEETLDEYKQRVLRVLDAKRDEHDWCGEYDEVIEELGIERPCPLPTGKFAVVDTNSGNKYVRVKNDVWMFISEGSGRAFTFTNKQVSSGYFRTIFEGEK